jgi:hypothetical protein
VVQGNEKFSIVQLEGCHLRKKRKMKTENIMSTAGSSSLTESMFGVV